MKIGVFSSILLFALLTSCAKQSESETRELVEQYLLLENPLTHNLDTLIRPKNKRVKIIFSQDFWRVLRGEEIMLQGQTSKAYDQQEPDFCGGLDSYMRVFGVAKGLAFYMRNSGSAHQTCVTGSLVDFDGQLQSPDNFYCGNCIVMSFNSY
jgi:hypothetical protein